MTYKFMVRGYNPPANEADNQPDWVMGLANTSAGAGKYSYAYNTNRSNWTSADYKTSDRNGSQLIRVGKNASGDGIFIIAQRLSAGGEAGVTNTEQLAVSGNDITDGTTWTNVSLINSSLQRNSITALQWSAASDNSTAGVWIAGTLGGRLFRSTDGGSSWTELTIAASNLPGSGTGRWRVYNDGQASDTNLAYTCVRDVTSEGNGTWVIIQKDRIYKSTNDGVTWSHIVHGIDFGATGDERRFFGIIYTNNSYVAAYRTQGNNSIKVRAANKSDLTTWGASVGYTGDREILEPSFGDEFNRVTMAADGSGKVMFASFERSKVGILDVSGTTISNPSAFLINTDTDGRIRDITTNGSAVWLVSAENSDIWESTDDGSSWTRIVNGHPDADTNLNCIASNYYLPL
jgi:hypothetical protein